MATGSVLIKLRDEVEVTPLRYTEKFKVETVRLAESIGGNEPPRILRRLKSLRGLSHEEVKQVFT